MIWLVVSVLCFFIGVLVGILLLFFYKKYKMEELQEMISILILWMKFIEKGNNIAEKLIANGIRKIAIYDVGYLSRRLIEQVKNTQVDVIYIIGNKKSVYDKFPVLPLSEDNQKVDAIIITNTYHYYRIKEKIGSILNYKILSIEMLLKDET